MHATLKQARVSQKCSQLFDIAIAFADCAKTKMSILFSLIFRQMSGSQAEKNKNENKNENEKMGMRMRLRVRIISTIC